MYKNFCSNCSKVFALLVICSIFTYPQGVPDALRLGESGLGANARALGMGNAYIGLSDDASAAYYNPAGLGLLKRLEFSGGIDYSTYNNNTTFFNNTSDYSNSTTRLDRLSFAFPFPTVRGSLVFGISYHNTKDFTGALKFNGFNSGNNSLIQVLNEATYYDNNGNPYNIPYDLGLNDSNLVTPIDDGHLNQSGTILNSGSTNNWTFSGAIEAAQNLFLGLNLNIITGSYNSNNDYYEVDTHNYYQGTIATGESNPPVDFQTFYLNRVLNWDISGWSAKAGLIYQFNNYGRFGLTVQFPKYYTVKENFTVNGSSTFANAQYNLNQQDYSDNVKYDIVSPFEFGFGFSINLKGLIFSGEGTAIDYSQLKFDNPDGISAQDVGTINKDIKDQLGAVINYNVGAEYTIPKVGLRLRTGYFVQPSAYKGDPSSFDRKYFTAGIGILAQETLGLDLAWAHGWWNTFGDNYGPDANGNIQSRTYQNIKYNKIMLTATYRF